MAFRAKHALNTFPKRWAAVLLFHLLMPWQKENQKKKRKDEKEKGKYWDWTLSHHLMLCLRVKKRDTKKGGENKRGPS